jgi:hypothetical protein
VAQAGHLSPSRRRTGPVHRTASRKPRPSLAVDAIGLDAGSPP